MDYQTNPSTMRKTKVDKCQVSTSNFDRGFYIKAYKDVNPRFTNPHTHYHTIGIKEDRLYNANRFRELYPLFDMLYYKEHNSDIARFTDEELMCHFHHSGRFECRVYMRKN
jgi:hypothetical protein